jgi:hypothetical protein
MLPPLPRCSRWAYSSLKLPHPYQPSPIPLSGRPAHRPFRGLLGVHSRCGLHTRAITKFVTATRGLQTFRHLHACPGCFRLERIAGWALHPLGKAPPCHGARGIRTFRCQRKCRQIGVGHDSARVFERVHCAGNLARAINGPACRRSRRSSSLRTEEAQKNLSLYIHTFGKY